MELGLLFLFGLTITSTAGSALPRPRSLPLPAGAEPRSAALGQKDREESEASALPAGGRAKVDGGALRRRARRCTCYTYKDKECVYYCHLDIIWINTPERTVPYGLSNFRGSYRGKRSTSQIPSTFPSSFRCSCVDAHDKQCMQFCRRTQDRRRLIDENTVANRGKSLFSRNHESVKKTEEEDQCREEQHSFIQ